MSGLFGYLSGPAGGPALPIVERMGARMRHQPHFVVECAAPRPGIALGRLGIGIFNRGPQPVRGAGGRVWLWLCGEFYHHHLRRAELSRAGGLAPRADDAELALRVYLDEGAPGLTRLEGAFTLAVWDERAAELLLVNDRYSLYPHYFARVGGGLAFGPEMKGVLEAPGLARRLDLTAVAQQVRFQQLLGDRTWFEGLLALPPASLLRFRPDGDRLSVTRYWDWDAITPRPEVGLGEAVEELTRLFRRAVDAMTAPPHRPGVYLSGGLDSRQILGFIERPRPVNSFTFGAAGSRDVVYGAELARRAGSRHHWFPLVDGRWVLEHAPLHLALTEGQHGWLHAHGMSTLAEARELIDVALVGHAGGRVMGSKNAAEYARQQAHTASMAGRADLLQRLYDAFCQRLQWPGLTEAEAESLFTGRGDGRLRRLAFDSLREAAARTAHYPAERRVDYFALDHAGPRCVYMANVFMRSAVEVRCPFMDYDLMTFAFSLSERLRSRPELRRTVLTRRMPRLAMVPYEKDDRIPHSNSVVHQTHATLQRGKGWVNRHVGFVFPRRPWLYADYEQYLRTDLRAWAENLLFGRRARERGLFDPDAVRALWERHLSGRELWTIGKLAPLMTVELVLRSLYDEDER